MPRVKLIFRRARRRKMYKGEAGSTTRLDSAVVVCLAR